MLREPRREATEPDLGILLLIVLHFINIKWKKSEPYQSINCTSVDWFSVPIFFFFSIEEGDLLNVSDDSKSKVSPPNAYRHSVLTSDVDCLNWGEECH